MRKTYRNTLLLLSLCLLLSTGCIPINLNFAVGRQDNTIFETGANYSNVSGKVVLNSSNTSWSSLSFRGTSPNTGFDCSGLIYWAYKQHGINVPRITKSQARVGEKIGRNGLRPGDILVFRTSRFLMSFWHTGLYAGGNKFIHAPNSRTRVKVETFNGSWWGKQFIYGRRIVVPRFAGR